MKLFRPERPKSSPLSVITNTLKNGVQFPVKTFGIVLIVDWHVTPWLNFVSTRRDMYPINPELQILLASTNAPQQFHTRHHYLMDQRTQHLRRLIHREFLS